MHVSDLEIAHASVELMGCFVSVLLAVIIIINRHREKSMKQIVKMLFLCAVLFISDALAYLFRGNPSAFSQVMTRVSNFSVFMMNFCLADTAIGYIYSILQEKQVTPSGIFRKIVRFGFWAAAALLVVNLFTGWVYSFDDANYYHRSWGWYVYTGLCLICMCVSCVPVVKYRRSLDKLTLFSLLLFELFPIVGAAIQLVLYGISFTNIGIGLSIVLILISYLINWNRSSASSSQDSAQQRRSYDTTILFVIMAVSVGASILSCIISIRHIAAELSDSSSQEISRIVNDRIENLFLRPITVTETMSKDYKLQNNMRQQEQQDVVEQEMAAYLESIRAGFDYQMVYAVCDQTGDYYTYDGFVKVLDPELDPTDLWYPSFLATGRDYALELDTDTANHWELSVFVNRLVQGSDGTLLGVCGIGLELPRLQENLSRLETKYDIKITLYDMRGSYQIASDDVRVGSGLLPDDFPALADGEEYRFQTQDRTPQTVRLMEDLGWFVLVEDLSQERVDVFKILLPNFLIFMAGMFLMAVAFCVITIRERNIAQELAEKQRTSLQDALTGLRNRRALQEDSKKIEQDGTLSEKTVILMDLNGLKQVNDTLGHHAGDALITGTAQCLSQAIQEHGQLYRTGGDEFVMILDCTQEELDRILLEFDQLAAAWKEGQAGPISTARGVVRCEEFPGLHFAAIIDQADRRMYEDKQRYYVSTGRKRRQ